MKTKTQNEEDIIYYFFFLKKKVLSVKTIISLFGFLLPCDIGIVCLYMTAFFFF